MGAEGGRPPQTVCENEHDGQWWFPGPSRPRNNDVITVVAAARGPRVMSQAPAPGTILYSEPDVFLLFFASNLDVVVAYNSIN